METKKLQIRPYARLLTMLGEQLIKNEQIALAELIKNSYDADADWVKISFSNFEKGKDGFLNASSESAIIIEDNGSGMTDKIIEKSWMNPATPNKRTKDGEARRTKKNRVIQGEKGIGRFAILKLGRKIKITTRPEFSNTEFVIDYDLSAYDDDFLSVNGEEKELYIDDISISVKEQSPTVIVDRDILVGHKKYSIDSPNYEKFRSNKGTRIEITNLKGVWSEQKIEDVYKESQKLESLFDRIFDKESTDDFNIGFEINEERSKISDETIEQLSSLFDNCAVLKIVNGKYAENEQCFYFNLNGIPTKLNLMDPGISGLSFFKKNFLLNKDLFGNYLLRKTTCGSFDFNFFVFDLNAKKDSKYYLDSEDKKIVKEHRIYLYRDKIRVAPYGDSTDDWIGTDKMRAVGKTGGYLSNDQVVGFIDISKEKNSKLKDKTNREGLIEEGTSTKDFIALIHSFLLYIRQHPYRRYQLQIEKKKQQESKRLGMVQSKFELLKEFVSGIPTAEKYYDAAVKAYSSEKEYFQQRIDYTEDLAGVGLSVETASHDIMMLLLKGISLLEGTIKDIKGDVYDEDEILTELDDIKDTFLFVSKQIRDLQLLFRSSKQRRKKIKVEYLLEKVIRIYQRTLNRENISIAIDKKGEPIEIISTDAVILQLLINLVDNSIYWLSITNIPEKKILITLDGVSQELIFSDNGPGVNIDDKPYIFEPFYSGKEDGRGLGLYIARQLLERMGFSIDLMSKEKVLSGANFIINFKDHSDND